MDVIFKTLAEMTWQDWLTAISFFFGIVSLWAYVEQKRATKQQETFYTFAKRHVDKDITEEELKVLLAQKVTMENQITQQIPSLARVAVLKEQSELHTKAITEHYTHWKNIENEIEEAKNVNPIDPRIEAIILDRILPQHERQRQHETLRTRVTVLSVSMALATSVLPFPINKIVVYLFAVPLINALIKLLSLQDDFPHYAPWLRRAFYLIYLGISATFFIIAGITLTASYRTESSDNFAFSAIALATIMLLFSPFAKKVVDNSIKSLLPSEVSEKQ